MRKKESKRIYGKDFDGYDDDFDEDNEDFEEDED